MIRDHHDAIIDQLLREILGGDRPRDMTARVLAQARIIDRFRRRRWLLTGLALAASVTLIFSLFLLWPQSYPAPHAENMWVDNDSPFERGVAIAARDTQGSVTLGGYVQIEAKPDTKLTVGGTRFREKVFLEKGEVDVAVSKKRGEFDVVVGPATVHVTGTTFSVRVTEENTATAHEKKMRVAVREGGVLIRGLPQAGPADVPQTLAAGEQREYVLSTEPRLLSPPRPRAAAIAAATQAATQLARGGNRGPLATRLAEEFANRPTRPNAPGNPAGARTPLATPSQPPAQGVRLISSSGSGARYGKLRRNGDLYYLESSEGNFFMFQKAALQNAHAAWLTLPLDLSTRVVWTDGQVVEVTQ
jgi:ferric-dicitrate binding protein FerR (iron transport regulator)